MARNYCAPEILLLARYNAKSDIWSAGCILYELATGQSAFDTDEAIRKYAWMRIFSAPPVVESRQDLTHDIDDMVQQTLQISAETRPDAATVLEAIFERQSLKLPFLEIQKTEIQKIYGSDGSLGLNRYMAKLDGEHEHVIVETHAVGIIADESDVVNSSRLRHLVQTLRSLRHVAKSFIPFCFGFLQGNNQYSLIFQNPALGPDNHVSSLEYILSNSSHPAHKELILPQQKFRVAAGLAWTIHAIHTAKHSHRAIGAHNIVIQTLPMPTAYLMGFDLVTFRSVSARAKQITSSLEWRDRLYQHPECQSEDNYEFHREYDYYSFGVVMLELARMQSFALLTGKWRNEMELMSAEKLQWFRTERAKELREVVGDEYMRAMLLCLTGEFGQCSQEEMGLIFKENVCDVLDRLVDPSSLE
jgi:Protein kinase domain/Protein tyrosine and serine/threonine kinase